MKKWYRTDWRDGQQQGSAWASTLTRPSLINAMERWQSESSYIIIGNPHKDDHVVAVNPQYITYFEWR